MTPTREFLAEVGRLAAAPYRSQAARNIARALGGSDLVVFLHDEEVGRLLPAPGFRQTFPDGKAWREFLRSVTERGQHHGVLPISRSEVVPAAAYTIEGEPGAALIILGAHPDSSDMQWLLALTPLIVGALRADQIASRAAVEARLAQDSATRAVLLAQAVDRTRLQLEEALRSADASRVALIEANAALSDQALEQELISEQLRDQAQAQEELAAENARQAARLKQTVLEVEEARAVAEQASKAKSEFLATMSHELRTPLNAIGGHVALLTMGLHGPVTDEQKNALARVDRSQRHLLGLINDILNLSRIEAGKVEYRLTAVSLADTMNGLAPMITPQLGEKQLAYSVDLPDDLPNVFADREKLDQVLLNLLSNAVKFTPEGGKVRVEARASNREPGRIYIRVSDTGIGIPGDKLETVFEPFTQVDASHSRLGQGTGLGLAISRDLARGMGGDLWARSTVGKGSSFTLSLGAVGASDNEPRVRSTSASPLWDSAPPDVAGGAD